eukprot:Awhi_evm1s501
MERKFSILSSLVNKSKTSARSKPEGTMAVNCGLEPLDANCGLGLLVPEVSDSLTMDFVEGRAEELQE